MTNDREFVKSWTAVEEYVYLQTLLKMFSLGIPVLLRRTPLGNIENSVGSMFIPALEKSLGVLVICYSTGESKLN